MSRFKINNEGCDRKSLPESTIQHFVDHIVTDWNKGLSDFIRESIARMKCTSETYHIAEYLSDYTIVLNVSSQSNTTFCIGYPFPIYQQIMSSDYEVLDTTIKVCVHGMWLRKAQKEYFLSLLSQKVTVFCHEIDDETAFRDLFMNAVNKGGRELWYYDSYRFIGDSILNTYMMDRLCFSLNLSPILVSRQYRHLNSLYPKTLSITDSIKQRIPNQVYAFPDLLDNDSGWIFDSITTDLTPGLYLFPGKNYFFVTDEAQADIFSLNRPDVFLKEQNVFDYMQSCVQPFVSVSSSPDISIKLPLNVRSVYLNYSSSLEAKSLTFSEAMGLISILRSFNIEVWMSSGFDKKSKEIAKCLLRNYPDIRMVQTQSLADVSNVIKGEGIGLILSPDSAICHLAVKHNIPTIIVYKSRYWDSQSLVSLSAESPLGFCGPNPYYLPILLSSYTEEGMLTAVYEVMDYLLRGNSMILRNCAVAEFESLLSAFDKNDASKLWDAAHKLNLKYKLEVLYKYVGKD